MFILQLTAICNAEYRPFVFSKYPHHVRRTKSMAFKAIMIQVRKPKSYLQINYVGINAGLCVCIMYIQKKSKMSDTSPGTLLIQNT